MAAYDDGRLAEAEDWLVHALALHEESGSRQQMGVTHNRLIVVAMARSHLGSILMCIDLLGDLSHPDTFLSREFLPGHADMAGMDVLAQVWREVTGQDLPAAVREEFSRRANPEASQARPSPA